MTEQNARIKEQFENGVRLNRYGLAVPADIYVSYCGLLHYHLLNGVTNEEALKQIGVETSLPVEQCQKILDETLTFISDVLEVDLEETRAARNSDAHYCAENLETIIQNTLRIYHAVVGSRILYKDIYWNGDLRARDNLLAFQTTKTIPLRYADGENHLHEWSAEDNDALLYLIITRQQIAYLKLCELRGEANTAANNFDLTKINELLETSNDENNYLTE